MIAPVALIKEKKRSRTIKGIGEYNEKANKQEEEEEENSRRS